MMPTYGLPQLIAGLGAVRKNTIQIAEDIPQAQYDFRASPESRSVAETLVHIAWLRAYDLYVHEEAHLDVFGAADVVTLLAQSARVEKVERSKDEILELLRVEGERWVEWLAQLPEHLLAEQVELPDGSSASRFQMMMDTREHEMHHQAQLTVIERLLGIVPHSTRNLQGLLATV